MPTQAEIFKRISGHATGTSYFKGGLTQINEGGRGEIVDLPSGTRIIPHDLSKKVNNNNKTHSIVLNFTVQGNMIGNSAFANEMGSYITNKLTLALANS